MIEFENLDELCAVRNNLIKEKLAFFNGGEVDEKNVFYLMILDMIDEVNDKIELKNYE
jgi:hypothetical protein